MSVMINMTMAMSSSDDTKNPLTFDHDSEKLNIIFGTFATLIALFCLVFAALTWYTPRRRPSAQLRASNEHDLEHEIPRMPQTASPGTSGNILINLTLAYLK
jgi:hypothetical protein